LAIHAVQLAVSHPDSEAPEAAGSTCSETENSRLASSQDTGLVNSNYSALIQAKTVNITSDYQVYPAYTASPVTEGNCPAIVIIHSFKGFARVSNYDE
jgi:carboxymethylenebutenolidase